MRTVVWWMLMGFVSAASAADLSRSLGTYAVLGFESVDVRAGVHVASGDVAANRGTVTLGPGARVDGTVAASTVQLARTARVGGLFCDLVEGRVDATCGNVATPVVTATLPLVQVVAGSDAVAVPARAATAPLLPGAYADVTVGAGARLYLAGGHYAVRSLRVRTAGRLLCLAPCAISVREQVRIGRRARLAAGSPADGRLLRIDVETGGPTAAFKAAPGAHVAATVYAPNGSVVLGAGGKFTGAFVGRTMVIRSGAQLVVASGF